MWAHKKQKKSAYGQKEKKRYGKKVVIIVAFPELWSPVY